MKLTKKKARKMGSKISPRKAKSSAANGKLGGRPFADANVSAHAILEAVVKLTQRPPLKV